MPTDTMLERPLPRSALRYRPINTKQDTNVSGSTARATPLRRSRPAAADTWQTADELADSGGVSPRRRASVIAPSTPRTRNKQHAWRLHPLFFAGISMLVMILLWIGITQAITWGTNVVNGWRYGYPRTFQTDAVVGHQDSASAPSHFLALNYHGQIEVIEFPGGDSTHARIFLGPQLIGSSSDLAPVTLRFVDLNGDGKPDMVITVQGSQIVFLNDQGSFRPLKPGEQNQIMQRLRQLGG